MSNCLIAQRSVSTFEHFRAFLGLFRTIVAGIRTRLSVLPTVVERLLSLELILDTFPIWASPIEKKPPRHHVYPARPPSKYYLGPTMLNLRL